MIVQSPPNHDLKLLLAQHRPAIYAQISDFWNDNKRWIPEISNESEFLNREADFQRLKEAALRARSVETGWDGYDAPSPNEASINVGLQLIERLRKTALKPYSVLPSADGGIGISFRGQGGKRAMLEILNDGSASFMIYGKGHPKLTGEFDATGQDLAPVFTQLLENL